MRYSIFDNGGLGCGTAGLLKFESGTSIRSIYVEIYMTVMKGRLAQVTVTGRWSTGISRSY